MNDTPQTIKDFVIENQIFTKEEADKLQYWDNKWIIDNEYPEKICWTSIGVPSKNSICVIMRVLNPEGYFYAIKPSPVFSPPMIDRIFGVDVWDNQVIHNITHELFEVNKGKIK